MNFDLKFQKRRFAVVRASHSALRKCSHFRWACGRLDSSGDVDFDDESEHFDQMRGESLFDLDDDDCCY